MEQEQREPLRQKELLSPYELENRLAGLAREEGRSRLLMFAFFFAAIFLLAMAFVAHARNNAAAGDGSAFQHMDTVFVISCAAAFVLFGIFLVKSGKERKRIKLLASDNITRTVLGKAFELVSYDPLGFLSSGEVSGAGLVENWNTISGSDLVKGRYRDVDFSFSDITLSYIDESDSEAKLIGRFEGQWLAVGLNAELPSPIWLLGRKGLGKLAKSDMETGNAAFDKTFQIRTQDPQAAQGVLAPQLQDSLLRIGQKAGAGTYVSFIGRQCNIALYSRRDLFEAGSVKLGGKNGIEHLRVKIGQDAKFITDILDELLLHGHLFGEGGGQ